MRRQDDQGFPQGNDQDGNHRLGHDTDEFAHDAGDEHQRQKGHDGGGDGHDHRPADFSHAVHHGAVRGFSLSEMGIDILSHDNGIVYQDAQGHDEGEQGDHVDGRPVIVQDHEGPHERDGNADGHPERQAQVEKQGQDDEDENDALEPVAQQQVDTVPHHGGQVDPGGQLDAGRHAVTAGCHILLHRVGDGDHIFLAGAVDLDQGRRLAVEAGLDVRILEPVDHRGHLAQPDHGAVCIGDQRQVLELFAGIQLALGTDDNLAMVGLDGSAGQIEASGPQRLDDLVETQTVSPQVLLGHLHRNFVVPHPHQRGQGDRAGIHQVIPDAVRRPAKELFGHIPINRHGNGRVAVDDLGDNRIFGLIREGLDEIHLVLDVIHDLLDIGPFVQFHGHRSQAFTG